MPESVGVSTPDAAEAQAREALRSGTDTAHLADAVFRPIPGGLSNYAWRVSVPTADFFVRLARGPGDMPGVDHANERRVLELTTRAGLSPPVVRCDPAVRLLVTSWVDAPDPGRRLQSAGELSVVARALASLHALPAPSDLRSVDFATQAHELEASLAPERGDGPLRARAGEVFAKLREQSAIAVLCHNDLNPLNLLWERPGRLWLVDWEYAGLGDRAIDLASFASQHGLDARRRRLLVAAYVAAGGVLDAHRLDLARWAFDYVQWLWYRLALVSPATGVDAGPAPGRAARLATSLRGRASRVLRCNNAPFAN
ncbi:MAG TPA: choline/ethanolamine kinase family protein [Steroidobacteraceae bacterium]|nr:choline/ethanolamine kinase family protein [Steroidobacteraceae bacterium]